MFSSVLIKTLMEPLRLLSNFYSHPVLDMQSYDAYNWNVAFICVRNAFPESFAHLTLSLILLLSKASLL